MCSDICPRTLSVARSERFSENVAQGKLSFEEQIMSKDKYPSIFLRKMEAIVCIIQIFFPTRAVLKIGEYTHIAGVLLCFTLTNTSNIFLLVAFFHGS